jgi:hypothetical protein
MTARPSPYAILVAVLATTCLSIACDGTSSSGTSTDVALFVNSNYVDYFIEEEEEPEAPAGVAARPVEGGASDSEASNVEAALESFGANVTTFEGVDADDLESALADAQVLALPEPEFGSYDDAFDGPATNEIVDFVADGGRLITFMSRGDSVLGFLNGAFGWSLEEGEELPGEEVDALFAAALTGYVHNVASAEGTPFSTGSAELQPHSLTLAVSIASLPGSAASMYDDEDDASALVVLPYGAGYVVIMGWDWYNAAPVGEKDGGWNAALNDAIRF